MRSLWIRRKQKTELLLFVNGWGMDDYPFRFLQTEQFDIFMLYDYRDLSLPDDLPALFQPYKKIYLLAWSFGVWACQYLNQLLPSQPVLALAINGTLQPVHPQHGIHPAIFTATLENLSATTLADFYRNMFVDKTWETRFLTNAPQRCLNDQTEELKSFKQLSESEELPQQKIQFNHAIIGKADRIFPAKNQLRFWKNHTPCQILNTGHFPFYHWQTWEDIFQHAGCE